jgi:DNA-binding response OmpR family regulator
MSIHILLVEDDPTLAFVTKDNLEEAGYSVTHCPDGVKGWNTFKEGHFDLCILDVMMPKKDGFTLAQEIRQRDSNVPIIFLTAKTLKEDKLKGFGLGADDYITKPFNIEELIFRIEVFVKRTAASRSTPIIAIGTYQLDYPNLLLVRNGVTIKKMTQKEGDVLRLLAQTRNNIVKREDILIKIWGENDYFMGRSLDVFITKLRKYLKDDESIEIQNHHGIGFKLVAPE